jgi:hypothetical protein
MKLKPLIYLVGDTDHASVITTPMAEEVPPDLEAVRAYLETSLGYTADAAAQLIPI